MNWILWLSLTVVMEIFFILLQQKSKREGRRKTLVIIQYWIIPKDEKPLWQGLELALWPRLRLRHLALRPIRLLYLCIHQDGHHRYLVKVGCGCCGQVSRSDGHRGRPTIKSESSLKMRKVNQCWDLISDSTCDLTTSFYFSGYLVINDNESIPKPRWSWLAHLQAKTPFRPAESINHKCIQQKQSQVNSKRTH